MFSEDLVSMDRVERPFPLLIVRDTASSSHDNLTASLMAALTASLESSVLIKLVEGASSSSASNQHCSSLVLNRLRRTN